MRKKFKIILGDETIKRLKNFPHHIVDFDKWYPQTNNYMLLISLQAFIIAFTENIRAGLSFGSIYDIAIEKLSNNLNFDEIY